MTKKVLALGAKTTTASSWCNENNTLILGFHNSTKRCNGNASTFAKALKEINSGQLNEESMEMMIELTQEEVFMN
jgi:hypothetical protein